MEKSRKYLIGGSVGLIIGGSSDIRFPQELEVNDLSKAKEILEIKEKKPDLPEPEVWLGHSSFGGKGFIAKNVGPIKFLMKDVEKEKTSIYYTYSSKNVLNIPFLINNLLYMKLLRCGIAVLHASTVSSSKFSVSFSAWQETGKTTTTLRFIKHGFRYVSDDRSFLGKNRKIFPYPVEIIKKPHLPYLLTLIQPKLPKFVRSTFFRGKKLNLPIELNPSNLKYFFLLERNRKKMFEKKDFREIVPLLIQNFSYEVRFDSHNQIKQYAYINPKLDLKKLEKEYETLLTKRLKNVVCYKLCSPDRQDFAKMALNLIRKEETVKSEF